MPRRHDPRVFAPNFGMVDQKPENDPLYVESPPMEAEEDPGMKMTSVSPAEGNPSPESFMPRYGPKNPFTDFPIMTKRRQESSAGSITDGAFYSEYVDGSGDTYLQGGQVISGSGNFSIADIKVIDAGTGITESNGDLLVLEVTVDGYVVDGVLLAGLTATAAAYVSPSVSSLPGNTLPIIGSHTGRKVYVEIGRWAADNFYPASPGNIRISFCPGAYTITRF